MVKRKQSKPNRARNNSSRTVDSNGIHHASSSTSSAPLKAEEGHENFAYVAIESSSSHGDGYFDLAEVVLCDLKFGEGMASKKWMSVQGEDVEFSIRLRLNMQQSRNARVGFWPLIPAKDVSVEFLLPASPDGCSCEEEVFDSSTLVLFEGYFDGPDEGVSGLAHLISQGFITLRMASDQKLVCQNSSCRVQILITKKAFDACSMLSESLRHSWKKSMVNAMSWLRPEVATDEAIYGSFASENMEANFDLFSQSDAIDDLDNHFDTIAFYEAIKTSKEEPMLEVNFPELLPELRPYQRRASYWMVHREMSKIQDATTENQPGNIKNPLCVVVSSINSQSKIYYNPFSGSVSMHPEGFLSSVPGGILADEMGLGKTVELLACILAHPQTSAQSNTIARKTHTRQNGICIPLKRPKLERVECVCGSVTESHKYTGFWVQCDVCDAWQHRDCVGFRDNGEARANRRDVELSDSTQKFWSFVSSSRNMSSKRRKASVVKDAADVIEIEEKFICKTCSELLQIAGSEVVSGATLIVCPEPILQQWQTEISRHTKRGFLKVQVYRGVKNVSTHSPLEAMETSINELANADIVLTTYDVLKKDLAHDSDRHQGDRRSMRFQKRYLVVPTPLTKIRWWRLCLDEAQMVESNTAAATEMAMRLSAQHLWCVTGTPIQQNLEDMYGLLRFLKAEPFDDHRWWSEVIKIPYEVSDELNLPPQEEHLSWLMFSPIEAHFYKRQHESCAVNAREFIAKCKDDVCIKSRQCDNKSHIIGSEASYDSHLTHRETAKLLNSLLKLRQACCHPQVGSSGLRSLQQTPMTMEEILQVLIGKAKNEGEESLRKLIVALNGMAALAIIEKDLSHAVSLYREALTITEEYREDFRLDPLLNLHIVHNLAEIIDMSSNANTKGNFGGDESSIGPKDQSPPLFQCSQVEDCMKKQTAGESVANSSTRPSDQSSPRCNPCLTEDPRMTDKISNTNPQIQEIPRTLRDDFLVKECNLIKEKYMLQFTTKLAAARDEFRSSYSQVMQAKEDCRFEGAENWWLGVLELVVQQKDLSKDLLDKIQDSLSGTDGRLNSSRLGSRFQDINGLKYIVLMELDALENSRKVLVDRLMDVDKIMDNPEDSYIERIRSCSNCQATNTGILCLHCEMDELFQVYENRLFLLRTGEDTGNIASAEEALNLQKQRSALNRFFGGLCQKRDVENDYSSGMKTADKNGRQRQFKGHIQVSRSPSELEVILNIVKTFLKARVSKEKMSSAKKHLHVFEAMRKEFTLARSLSVVQAQVMRAHDELKMAISRLRLQHPGEEVGTLGTLCKEDLVPTSVQLTGEKFVALTELSRMKGQLRYLKGLSLSKQRHKVVGTSSSGKIEGFKTLEQTVGKNGEETCPVCHEKLDTKFMVFPCGHQLCCKCMVTMVDVPSPLSTIPQRKKIVCPTCRYQTDFINIAYADDDSSRNFIAERKINELQDGERSESSFTVQGSFGTKMAAVTRRILWIKFVDPEAKILVFSCWKDVLDVLEHSLRANDISFVRMKGGSNADVAIKQFKGIVDQGEQPVRHQKEKYFEPKPIQVLLMLFRHGANGLNLLEAQHVILIEPLLNPAAEAQAINRVHRIGQEKKTFVHRFIVKETVEESIYKLNSSKPVDLSGTFGNVRKKDRFSLTIKDIDSLFSCSGLEKTHDESTENSTEVYPTRDLRDLPPAVAAAMAAESRHRQAAKNGI
ncbi:uncharacterized protein LOC131060147 isoform X2 [Cryptomeria japonica]|uniref:uncharacterized protein LOC131060147 isoform X2 n=1 Tax=Cryptomeria japonica TaxID=3369 RepID=UPI0027DA8570|nr:uncharacterized protein LOC131060147 isoform X2 [Cryptomeria japonica]